MIDKCLSAVLLFFIITYLITQFKHYMFDISLHYEAPFIQLAKKCMLFDIV